MLSTSLVPELSRREVIPLLFGWDNLNHQYAGVLEILMLSKFSLALGLAIVSSLVGFSLPAAAQNCTANCRSDQIQFTPGAHLDVEVVNQTSAVVYVQQVPLMAPDSLLPRQTANIGFKWGTAPNVSIRFWNNEDQPVKAYLFRPDENTLRVEVRNFAYELSDRAIYIQNDGRVLIY